MHTVISNFIVLGIEDNHNKHIYSKEEFCAVHIEHYHISHGESTLKQNRKAQIRKINA